VISLEEGTAVVKWRRRDDRCTTCSDSFWIEDISHDVMTSHNFALIHAAKWLLQSPGAVVMSRPLRSSFIECSCS
jgi:hypothetical protein